MCNSLRSDQRASLADPGWLAGWWNPDVPLAMVSLVTKVPTEEVLCTQSTKVGNPSVNV